jgi:phage-related protein
MTFLKNGWCPDLPAVKKTKPRKRTAQFGDGYEQSILDGINNQNVSWTLKYSYRKRNVILQMEDYLRTNSGGVIQFYDYDDDVTYNVYYDEWSVDWMHNDALGYCGTLSITFRRAYGAFP